MALREKETEKPGRREYFLIKKHATKEKRHAEAAILNLQNPAVNVALVSAKNQGAKIKEPEYLK